MGGNRNRGGQNRQPCRYFARGQCFKGDRCPFSHQQNDNSNAFRSNTFFNNNRQQNYNPFASSSSGQNFNNDFNSNRGGFNNNRGGFNNNRGGFNNNRGGFNNNRGGFNNNMGYDNNRGGFNNNRGGFNNNRGGFNNNRGGFNNNRGGFNNNRGGFSNNRTTNPFDKLSESFDDPRKRSTQTFGGQSSTGGFSQLWSGNNSAASSSNQSLFGVFASMSSPTSSNTFSSLVQPSANEPISGFNTGQSTSNLFAQAPSITTQPLFSGNSFPSQFPNQYHQCVHRDKDCLTAAHIDMQSTGWPLTCYGHDSGFPNCFDGDLSPDELRWLFRTNQSSADDMRKLYEDIRQKQTDLIAHPERLNPPNTIKQNSTVPVSGLSSQPSTSQPSTTILTSVCTTGTSQTVLPGGLTLDQEKQFKADRFEYGKIPEIAPPI